MTGEDTTFDEELLIDGLWLSLIGMGVVFSVLILLALSIKAFDRIDSLIPEAGTAGAQKLSTGAATPAREIADPPQSSESDDERTAAAIAVALALAEVETSQSSSSHLVSGALARSAANIWVAAGRTREMGNRLAGQLNRTRSGR